MGTAPAEPSTRVRRVVLERLKRLERGSVRRSPRIERLLLLIAATIFAAATVLAAQNLPQLGAVRWPPLLLVAVVGVPAMVVLNTAEYRVSARVAGHRVGLRAALHVAVLASAANVLPIPGSVLMRIRGLRQLGAPFGKATSSTAVMGLAWIGTACLLAGVVQIPAGRAALGFALLVVALLTLGLSYLLLRTHVSEGVASRMALVAALESGYVVVTAFRIYLVLLALGATPSAGQALALAVAVVVASATGFFPGGLGVRELLAGGMSPLVGLPAAMGVIVVAVDRLIAMVALSLITGGVLALDRVGASMRGPGIEEPRP